MPSTKLYKRTPKENELQTAIVTSLQVWCGANNIRCTALEYYANQQGPDLRKVCADFLVTLDDSELLLAEVKVQAGGALQSFDVDQHIDNVQFELCGVPIIYLYNSTTPIPYYVKPQPGNYAERTLQIVNYSKPRSLPGEIPLMENHRTLIDWLKGATGRSSNPSMFTELFGMLRSEALISNGFLMLGYGTRNVSLIKNLSPKNLKLIINMLKRGVAGKFLNPLQQDRLKQFLAEEEAVFQRWYQPAQSPDPDGGQDPDDQAGPQRTSSKPRRPGPGLSR